MLRRIIIFAISVFIAVAARADEKSVAILGKVNSALKSYGNYEAVFTASANMMDDIEGRYIVSGDKFSITVGGQTHFSDGKARYEIYDDIKEVVIDKADLSQSNVLSNPARAFEFAPDEFESELQEPVSGGGTYDVVRLVPLKGGYAAGTVIYLYVDKTSSLPGKIVYNYDGETVNITIDKITPLNKVDKDIFTFDASKYKDYEIIDFR